MEYYINETEANEIQAQIPSVYQFSFQRADGIYIHSSELVSNWNDVNIDNVFNSLYGQTYQEFLDAKLAEMAVNPLYKAELIENIYAPLGRKVIALFMGRNSVDGITNEQSKHVIEKGKEVTDFLSNGAINDALEALNNLSPDDMSEAHHWLNQERIDLVKADIYRLLSEL